VSHGSGEIPPVVSPRKQAPRKNRKRSFSNSRRAQVAHERGKSQRARGRASVGELFERLVALQTRLRAPGGCPWDREQTHQSLRTFLIEETYEVLDALESGDSKKFAGELGDLLLQIIFHALLAQEAGRFQIPDVIESVHSKMVRRHPHVFGNVKADTSAEVLKNWEKLKAEERRGEITEAKTNGAGSSILAGVPRTLPALLEAHQLTRRAANIGFDWENIAGILEKLQEETQELRGALSDECAVAGGKSAAVSPARADIEEEVGDLLFVAVNVACFLGVDPEVALKSANRKFKRRFQWMEQQAARQGRRFANVPREQMEELWNASKSQAANRA
jgi:MazG family protein